MELVVFLSVPTGSARPARVSFLGLMSRALLNISTPLWGFLDIFI